MDLLRVGFRFNPTEEELVRHYLVSKLSGNPLPSHDIIFDCDVYGDKEPWEMWDLFHQRGLGSKDSKLDRYIYLFSSIKRVSKNGNNVVRKVGSSGGTWHGQTSGKASTGKGGLVWFIKKFQYRNKSFTSQDGRWFMQEYSLPGNDSLVLCRIGRNDKRKSQDTDYDGFYNPATLDEVSSCVVVADHVAACSECSCQTQHPAKRMKMMKDQVEEIRHGDGSGSSATTAISQATQLIVQKNILDFGISLDDLLGEDDGVFGTMGLDGNDEALGAVDDRLDHLIAEFMQELPLERASLLY